jgi:hypothetical protein
MTIDFSFRELEIFCKVVELESFSRAAEAVFLVQASVSERIASLEKKGSSHKRVQVIYHGSRILSVTL